MKALLLLTLVLCSCAKSGSSAIGGNTSGVHLGETSIVKCAALQGWSASVASFAVETNYIASCIPTFTVQHNKTIEILPDAKAYRDGIVMVDVSFGLDDCTVHIDKEGYLTISAGTIAPENDQFLECVGNARN